MANPKTTQTLGVAQTILEDATLELRNAQAHFSKAQERLSVAEEAHNTAQLALVKEIGTVRERCRVLPVGLK